MEELNKFLEEKGLVITPQLEVQDKDVFNSIKTAVVNLVLKCLKLSYIVTKKGDESADGKAGVNDIMQ